MEKYFDQGELEEDEMTEGMKKAMINHDMFPAVLLDLPNEIWAAGA